MKRATRSHRRLLSIETLEDRCCPASLSPAAPAAAATQAQLSQAYGQLPLAFEANQGQTDAQVNFLSRGAGYTLFLTPTQAVLDMQQATDNGPSATENVLRLQLVGSHPNAQAVGLDQLAGMSNYFLGNDPSQWHTGIANYGQVEYQGVYAGIDMVYSSYLGGNGNNDSGYGITVDGTGNAYVAGFTNSTNFPTTPGVFQPALHGSYDAFVTKIDPPAPAALTASSPLSLASVPAAGLAPQSGWQAADLVFSQGLRAGQGEPNAIDQIALLLALDQKKHALGSPEP